MSNINLKTSTSNFKIFNNVLMKYLGKGGVVVIPDGIQEISHFAFQSEECAKITEIVIPASVKEVNYPFSHCTALEKITTAADNQNYRSIDGNLYTKDGTTLVAYAPAAKEDRFAIPQGVTTVEAFAFSNCSLEELVIPSTVKSIENAALSGNIKRLLVDAENTTYYMHSGLLLTKDNKILLRYVGDESTVEVPLGVTHIATGAFARATLASITLPDTVQTIGNGAFSDCFNLETITLSQSLTSIEQYAFYGCKKLAGIALPDSLKSIGRNAFEGCSSLTEIEIPQGVTELDGKMFGGCTALKSVTIPNSVANISVFAFADCANVTIKGHKNSYAQTFAKEQEMTFLEI